MATETGRMDNRERVAGFGLILFFICAIPALGANFLNALALLDEGHKEVVLQWLVLAKIPGPLILVCVVASTIGNFLGSMILLFGLFIWDIRSRWFYRWMHVAGVVMLFSGPGIIVAILVGRFLFHKKAEFLGAPDATPTSNHPRTL